LVRRINAANESAKLADGRLLADVLALRDTLIAQHSLLISTISATNKDVDRYSQREIKWVPQIQVASLQNRPMIFRAIFVKSMSRFRRPTGRSTFKAVFERCGRVQRPQ
jgi:hypothetical protein